MSCPYCFGGEDTIMRESLTAGIAVLLGVTAVVLGCFARFFIMLVRRSREAARLKSRFFADDTSRLEARGSRLEA